MPPYIRSQRQEARPSVRSNAHLLNREDHAVPAPSAINQIRVFFFKVYVIVHKIRKCAISCTDLKREPAFAWRRRMSGLYAWSPDLLSRECTNAQPAERGPHVLLAPAAALDRPTSAEDKLVFIIPGSSLIRVF